MARALCSNEGANWDAPSFAHTPNGNPPEEMREGYIEAAQAALAAIEAMGAVVVPREPTPEMLQAASAAMSPGKRPTLRFVSNSAKHRIRYQAMLAAAAAPTQQGLQSGVTSGIQIPKE